MELSNRALKVGLRVLTALNQDQTPDEADVAALRQFAPLLADEPLDFLAREVIQQALLRRAHFGYGRWACSAH